MSDENTTINSAVTNVPNYRLVEDGDKTWIVNAVTGVKEFYVDGKIGGDTVETMKTAERTAITPEAGQLIYDTDEGALYVGDGVTAGGIPVGSGGGGGGGTPATIKDIMTGSGASKILNVTNIRGALTAGQAVDVTSQPDSVTGDYKGTFTVTGSLGFASFPKYASGLSYLMIADLTATASGTVTPSGTWLDGTTAAKNLAAGTSTRVAMLFNAANKAKFTFTSTGSVSVSNCREYEVTACSTEAVAYIAQLASPDAFASYYLVKPDMVQPWTSIIDMGSSPAVTIASGLSYKLNATTGTHQLTVDTCPAGYDGRDAIIRITLGGSGVIQAVSPLQLGGALTPYAINNCVIRFRDGEAVLLVEDTLAGYIVTLSSGTGEGSLPYGLAASGMPYVAFSTSTDGIPIDLSGATTAAEEVTVVGNGYEETILTGSITCTSKTTVANLALQDVVVNGGTMTLGDAFIPSGSTVAVSGGGLAVEKVTGAGNASVIDFGHDSATQTEGTQHVFVSSNTTANVSSCTMTNGYVSASYGGAIFVSRGKAATCNGVLFRNCHAYRGGAVAVYGYNPISDILLSSCTFDGNTAAQTNSNALYIEGATVTVIDCDFRASQNTRAATDGNMRFGGSNTFKAAAVGAGIVSLASGAVLDLTGNMNTTPVNMTGSIIVDGGCFVITSAGSTVSIAGGTYTAIKNDGTTVPPQQ